MVLPIIYSKDADKTLDFLANSRDAWCLDIWMVWEDLTKGLFSKVLSQEELRRIQQISEEAIANYRDSLYSDAECRFRATRVSLDGPNLKMEWKIWFRSSVG